MFNPNDPANRLYPPQLVLDDIFNLLNHADIKEDETALREAWKEIWSEDETIGWVYQYFTPKELRDRARRESRAPRNSYELAFRNQFYTPRYIVEFLSDNSLGRIWYEMRKGETRLAKDCQYMVRRPNEIFLSDGENEPSQQNGSGKNIDPTREGLLSREIYIPHRTKKDPREIRILDPASGSGHFLLYCFDLLLTIYEEAYDDIHLGPKLKADYPEKPVYMSAVPCLILAHNLFGIDIDLRASQIAAFALWLRSQRQFNKLNIKKPPTIEKTNLVVAAPMPGADEILKEFISDLEPKLLRQLVEIAFEKMKLGGEIGSLLRVENCLLYTSPSPRDRQKSRMPSSA